MVEVKLTASPKPGCPAWVDRQLAQLLPLLGAGDTKRRVSDLYVTCSQRISDRYLRLKWREARSRSGTPQFVTVTRDM